MQTDEADEQSGTAAHIAQRVANLQMIFRTINIWADNNQEAIPRGANKSLATIRTLLSMELLDLESSLKRYDAALSAVIGVEKS
jgi:hypothetical protein